MAEKDRDPTWPADPEAFAAAWMAEIRSQAPPEPGDIGDKVVTMNFFGSPETQWAFLLAASAAAQSENEMAAVAAGPFEHLLAYHGEDYIDQVEAKARDDPEFAAMIVHSWRHAMSDEVWARVQAVQAAARVDD